MKNDFLFFLKSISIAGFHPFPFTLIFFHFLFSSSSTPFYLFSPLLPLPWSSSSIISVAVHCHRHPPKLFFSLSKKKIDIFFLPLVVDMAKICHQRRFLTVGAETHNQKQGGNQNWFPKFETRTSFGIQGSTNSK